MLKTKLRRIQRISNKLFGRKPTVHVVWRYLIDRHQSKKSFERQKERLAQACRHPGSPKLAHVTIYSAFNAGDNVLSECVRRLFEMKMGPIDWELIHLFDPVTDATVARMNDTRGIIIGGGGLFLPDTNANEVSGWEWACDKRYYSMLTSPVFVFAVGYNYFKGQKREAFFEENVNALVRMADFFSLRNQGSIQEVRSFIDRDLWEKIEYQPCATMVARYLYPDLPAWTETGDIAFNVGMDRIEKRMGGQYELVLTQIAHSMKLLAQKGYKLHFITHCDSDIRFIRYLDREHFKYEYHHATTWETRRVLEFYNQMDMVIGMRGHGIWIPFGLNCHILALGNQNKTRWFLEDIGAPDWNVELLTEPDTLCERILKKFEDIHEKNGSETTRRLMEAQQRLWKLTCENLERMIHHIETD